MIQRLIALCFYKIINLSGDAKGIFKNFVIAQVPSENLYGVILSILSLTKNEGSPIIVSFDSA